MPLFSGTYTAGGNLDRKIQQKINQFLILIDSEINQIVKTKSIETKIIRALYPLNVCVVFTNNSIFAVATNKNVGGLPEYKYFNAPGETGNLNDVILFIQKKFFYENAFGLTIPKNIMELNQDEQKTIAKHIAEKHISDEIDLNEKLNNIVRFNPIFIGRDFNINENLVFMLSPFSEPYNTIFTDHIKPTIEKINNFLCIRADNIYDNKPIIEDIWKNINESLIIIAELTGRNPNVFYEIGIAHTIGKEVILITQDINDVPFDLRHLRCIVYDYTPRGINTLETNLNNTVMNIINRKE
jgi:hypothetical protein